MLAKLPSYEASTELVSSTGRVTRLLSTFRLAQSWQASWSPDRSLLAWVTQAGLTVAHPDGTERRVLVRAQRCIRECVPMSFSWSPDGKRLLVGGAGKETNRLLVVSARTGRAVDLVRPHLYTEYSRVAWAPRGGLILYTRSGGHAGTRSCCTLDLVVARSDGSAPRRVFRFREAIHDVPAAAWSRDGRSIAFTSEGRDPHDPRLAVVDVATVTVHAIKGVEPWSLEAPAWDPGSGRLAVGQSTGQVITLTASGKDVRGLGASGNFVTWSRDGSITLVHGDQSREVWQSADGKSPARLLFRLPARQGILSIDPR